VDGAKGDCCEGLNQALMHWAYGVSFTKTTIAEFWRGALRIEIPKISLKSAAFGECSKLEGTLNVC
jgi:hypothetical protein